MRDKHQVIEEPDEAKVSRPVLETSESREGLAEFNTYPNYQTIQIIIHNRKHYLNSKRLILGTEKSIHRFFRM